MNKNLTLLQTKRHTITRAEDVPLQSERSMNILSLLTAQIRLLKQVEKNMHARIRPELELILQSDPWRERLD